MLSKPNQSTEHPVCGVATVDQNHSRPGQTSWVCVGTVITEGRWIEKRNIRKNGKESEFAGVEQQAWKVEGYTYYLEEKKSKEVLM